MASSKLKVIALISGGKDSLFSILHCLAAGHDVVALANLHPPILPGDNQIEDIDSFMYQTIGHNVIPLYAEALGIPLFREEIMGGAVDTGREYGLGDNGDDETEDLVPLLETIKAEIPEANAVSTGAILSTYQRTRVETIAIRLGFTPLSYLWQYLYLPPYGQMSLLDDMRAVGQEAKIIKVASGGLDETFLWQDVANVNVITRMRRRMEMYGGGEGGALIGEGGEFETLAVDGPAPPWKKRIEVEHVENVSGEGGSSFARLTGLKLVDKGDGTDDSTMDKLRRPPLLDIEFEQVFHELENTTYEPSVAEPDQLRTEEDKTNLWTNITEDRDEENDSTTDEGYLQLANIMPPPYGSTKDQMTDIIHQTMFKLHGLGLEPSDIVHSTILLRSMTNFADINPIYGSMFTKPSPPSRVTISCGELMPSGIDISLSTIVQRDRRNGLRKSLHVQSRSYWAPANIGPYSQAISIPLTRRDAESDIDTNAGPELVHIAGQIPLVPASMEMITADQLPWEFRDRLDSDGARNFIAQSVLSLQHLWRIGRAMDVTGWTGAVAFISRCTNHEAIRRAKIVRDTWYHIHNVLRKTGATVEEQHDNDDAEDYDVWDIKNRVAQISVSESDSQDIRAPLPNFSKITNAGSEITSSPVVFAVQVAELPRNADIEWCSTGIASATGINFAVCESSRFFGQTCSVQISATSHVQMQYVAFYAVDGLLDFVGLETARKMTIYATKPVPKVLSNWVDAMFIPCFSIHGQVHEELKSFEAIVVVRKNILQSDG